MTAPANRRYAPAIRYYASYCGRYELGVRADGTEFGRRDQGPWRLIDRQTDEGSTKARMHLLGGKSVDLMLSNPARPVRLPG